MCARTLVRRRRTKLWAFFGAKKGAPPGPFPRSRQCKQARKSPVWAAVAAVTHDILGLLLLLLAGCRRVAHTQKKERNAIYLVLLAVKTPPRRSQTPFRCCGNSSRCRWLPQIYTKHALFAAILHANPGFLSLLAEAGRQAAALRFNSSTSLCIKFRAFRPFAPVQTSFCLSQGSLYTFVLLRTRFSLSRTQFFAWKLLFTATFWSQVLVFMI